MSDKLVLDKKNVLCGLWIFVKFLVILVIINNSFALSLLTEQVGNPLLLEHRYLFIFCVVFIGVLYVLGFIILLGDTEVVVNSLLKKKKE